MTAKELRVLALLEHYLPGYKAGGPLRTVRNMVEQMGPPFSFLVVTRDRDVGDEGPYPGVEPGTWHPAGGGRAMYLPPRSLGPRGLARVLRGTPYDVLYLNSLFAARMTILPLLLRRLRAVPRTPVVLAPRGELHPGALSLGGWGRWMPRAAARRLPSAKYLKKRCFLAVARVVGLYRGVTWQAANEGEAAEVRARMGPGATVVVAPDLAARPPASLPPRRAKRAGEARLLFLGRVHPTKNLEYALSLLARVRGAVQFDIYGPVDDREYWARCQAALARLPANVRARYHGPLPNERVNAALRGADLLLLPTLGESFGHVIVEALVQGCLALVSDRTPWRGLEPAHAGWDLPLGRPEAFRAAIQRVVDMGDDEYRRWSAGAAAVGRRHCADGTALRLNRALFFRAAGWPPRAGRALSAGEPACAAGPA